MILVNHYAIRPPIPNVIFVKHCRVEIMAFPFVLFPQRSFFQFVLPFPSAILFCISAQTLGPATTCPHYSLYQVWQTWACSLVFVQLTRWHTDVFRWSGGQPWRLSPFHCRRHCWYAHASLPAIFLCSHCLALVPFCVVCILHLIAVSFLQAIWLPERSLQLPSFLALFMSARDVRVVQILKNALLSFSVTWSLLSTCHMQDDWYCLALP